ncbi:hypothetical protein KPG71_07385 [Roseovarius sp. PS-C2]|uniref:hypothetical protein n=1 Tax=Roseovarius sp. PS-C2 TaxID=2820814 RepID=UPI001C0CEBF1|nr:hypothetical protein [Roseovarius sp. PS-C2]MBU3259829.1 hypothetical protein [Roseovarius sp. PS-C2]
MTRPGHPVFPARHERLFELIRQRNMARDVQSRLTLGQHMALSDVQERQAFLADAIRSLTVGHDQSPVA